MYRVTATPLKNSYVCLNQIDDSEVTREELNEESREGRGVPASSIGYPSSGDTVEEGVASDELAPGDHEGQTVNPMPYQSMPSSKLTAAAIFSNLSKEPAAQVHQGRQRESSTHTYISCANCTEPCLLS